jgi:hypothetical protein
MFDAVWDVGLLLRVIPKALWYVFPLMRRKVKKRPCQEHKSVCTKVEAFFKEKDSEDGSMKYRI